MRLWLMIASTWLSLSLMLAAQQPASARPGVLDQVRLEQRLGESIPLELGFVDTDGRDVRLGDYFDKPRPVLLTLVYYECPMLCNLVLNGLVRCLRALPFTPGEDFELVVVSIDPGETPEMATARRAHYLEFYARAESPEGWNFLCGDAEAVRRLADAVGFRYSYVEERDEYAHPAGIMLLTPEGRLSRYFYGSEYLPKDVRLGLVEASENRIGNAVDQVLLMCLQYDPKTGRYGFVILGALRIAGLATVIGIGVLIFLLLKRERRQADGGQAS